MAIQAGACAVGAGNTAGVPRYMPSTALSGFITPAEAVTGLPTETSGLAFVTAPMVLAAGSQAGSATPPSSSAPSAPPAPPPSPPLVPPPSPPASSFQAYVGSFAQARTAIHPR